MKAMIVKWVLKAECGLYVPPPGYPPALVASKKKAWRFSTKKAAQANARPGETPTSTLT